MRKEDVEEVAKRLSECKDSIAELEAAMKKNDVSRINAAKSKIINLQMQIGRKL